STTMVTSRIRDLKSNFFTRLKALSGSTPLKSLFIATIKNIRTGLISHLNSHKVHVDGEAYIPENFFAYITIKSPLQEKARNMIANNGGILGWLRENNIEVIGKPSLEVTSWKVDKDSIVFNYRFPIIEKDTFPEHPRFKFKKSASVKAIKATYYGNYRTSDRAWFSLYEYAKRQNIPIKPEPVEFFYDNPMLSDNELEWKAEIFMPLN
ncbi:MAG: GyrI-like domain-containing protein, partial [Flavobacteriaceae bacterium]